MNPSHSPETEPEPIAQRLRRTLRNPLLWVQWVAILLSVGLFAGLSLVVTLFTPAGRGPHGAGQTIFLVNGIAAALTALIAPYLLRAYDRMQQRLIRQNNELRSLHTLDRAINAELSLDAILQVAVREATVAVDGEFGALCLFRAGGADLIEAQTFYNYSDGVRALLGERIGARFLELAPTLAQPLRRRDLDQTWKTDQLAATLKLRNEIAVPIIRQETLLGILLIGNRGSLPDPLTGFTREDVQLLTAVASTIAVAIHNARVIQETQRRGKMLRTLVAQTGEAIAASSDVPRLMQLLADESARLMGPEYPRAAIYAYDEAHERFTPLAACDQNPPERNQLALFSAQPLPLARIADNRLDFVDHVRDALGLGAGYGEFLAAPGFYFVLRSRDNACLGLFCLLKNVARPAGPETVAFARALAAQAAVALENAMLARQTRDLLERTQALQRAAGEVAHELDPESALRAILESVRHVLDADGYAVWGRDGEGAWVCRAARGLLCGPSDAPPEAPLLTRALTTRRPEIVTNTAHVEEAGLRDETSLEAGRFIVRALLALPLLYAGKGIGVLALYFQTPRTFSPDAVDLAQSFAGQAAGALENARLFAELHAAYQREKLVAGKFQQSLLPPIPDQMGGFGFGWKYQAALEEAVIGGDFLDFFPLDETKVGLVMADVSGKGLRAAVQTAFIKYTLRAFAAEAPDHPGEVLTRVNHVLCSDLGRFDGFVTLFYGVLDLRTGELTYADAGHEPPLWRRQGAAVPLPPCEGIVLGAADGFHYTELAVTLAPGDGILLFTDGMTESRSPDGQFLGADGLADLLLSQTAENAQQAVDGLFAAVEAFTEGSLHDDIALLLFERASESS